jgi:hypothetical protein
VSRRAQPSRRDILGLVGAGLGVGSVLGSEPGFAHLRAQVPAAVASRPNPDFSPVPSWTTELKELAPNVYGDIRAGGPGRNAVRRSL